MGKKGYGKSPLLNIVTGQMVPDSGDVDVGETGLMGYYKQDGNQFN